MLLRKCLEKAPELKRKTSVAECVEVLGSKLIRPDRDEYKKRFILFLSRLGL